MTRQFPRARLLAIDLSATSLGYARARSEALGVANVAYAQADILRLGSIGQTFDLIQSDGACSSRRQINMSTRHKWSAIVDPDNDAAAMTDFNLRAQWQGTMRRSHGRTVHALAVRGATTINSV